jgi:hypothetical protein
MAEDTFGSTAVGCSHQKRNSLLLDSATSFAAVKDVENLNDCARF